MIRSSIFLLSFFFCMSIATNVLGQTVKISGSVVDESGVAIPGASVHVVGTSRGDIANGNGIYTISGLQPGTIKLRATFIGHQTTEVEVVLETDATTVTQNFVLQKNSVDLQEVVVTGKSTVELVKEKAFNVAVIDAKELHATSLDVAHALDRTSGVRMRESGGVGSQTTLSINGFRGNQVRIFIDGIPMETMGSAFQLNNIPVGLVERIEVYKGVVPISLGSDALGGAVNVITNSYKKSHADVSYSYGSFNTHRSIVNAIYVAPKSGFTVQLNTFQNYSDNNYKMRDIDVADSKTGAYYRDQTVRRFHDTYHNETAVLNVGVVNKPYADQLLAGITLGQSYKEIQTGARIAVVFGDRYQRGNIIMPSLKYIKNDLLTKGLNVRFTANYNGGYEQNVDTVNRLYNWFGQYKQYPVPGGESSRSLYKFRNNTGIAIANAEYRFKDKHVIALSNTFNSFDRKGEDELDVDNYDFDQPRKNIKNVAGLGYTYERDAWNASVFVKDYYQQNKFTSIVAKDGVYNQYDPLNVVNSFNALGYGAAVSWFVHDNLQLKASYETSYRLPESDELFGDAINLEANPNLTPELARNYNLGASLWITPKSDHRFNFTINGFYRDATDFIRPKLSNNQVRIVMENLGGVTNIGVDGEITYQYKNSFNAGINLSYQNLRNDTRFEPLQKKESIVYRDRIPNEPYLFGNGNVAYTFNNLWRKGHRLNVGYNLLYVHAFYLYWPSQGGRSGKLDIPKQLAHDITLTYTLSQKFQFTVECRNLADQKLYDNFSLPKPSRGFTAKIRYNIF